MEMLSDLWWIRNRQHYEQAYVCPALMTLTMWHWRYIKGRRCHWYSQQMSGNVIISPARVIIIGLVLNCACLVFLAWYLGGW